MIGLAGEDIYDEETIRSKPALSSGSVPSGLAAAGLILHGSAVFEFFLTYMHLPIWGIALAQRLSAITYCRRLGAGLHLPTGGMFERRQVALCRWHGSLIV